MNGPEPVKLVIFGVSGDLSQRFLLPALATLAKYGQLPKQIELIGLSRRALKPADILPARCRALTKFTKVHQFDTENIDDYKKLKRILAGKGQSIFYLAVPPQAVLPIVRNLGEAGLNVRSSKLLLEKPFGTDLASAKKLITQIQKYFDERQVYRIDHYLAKEAAQNIAVFLGSNAVFRDVWNRDFIDYVEIIASEAIGIEGRGELWEKTGTLRDFVQSHILQLTALTLMEPCDNFADFERLPSLRLAALKKLKVNPAKAWRGQYKGYRAEAGNQNSTIETFVALELRSSDPRWKDVPLYLGTGKKLNEKLTEIRVQFKKVSAAQPNRLVLRIQPKEGIEFDLWVKKPGPQRELEQKSLTFHYGQHFKRLPDAYEQVLLDAISSNHSLFASSDEVIESWRILQPILAKWSRGAEGLIEYKSGSSFEEVLSG